MRLQLLAKSVSGELRAAMMDRASTNNVAMHTMNIVYLHLLDIGRYSHTIDNDSLLDEVCVGLFAHSPKARRESETCWWSRWEVLKQVMLFFGDIEPFLQEN